MATRRCSIRQAQDVQDSQPTEAAQLYGELAAELETARYLGHAAVLRDRQIQALRAAGEIGEAIVLTAQLAVSALDRADRDEAARLTGRFSSPVIGAREGIGDVPEEGARLIALIREAIDYLGDPLFRPEQLASLLREPQAAAMPHYARLVLLLAEGMIATMPDRIGDIDDLLRHSVSLLGSAGSDPLGIRLRLVLADYDAQERSALLAAAGRYRVPGRLVALIHAREARRCVLEGRAEEAEEAWRKAIHAGIHEGLTAMPRS